jgi:hypothetical protein
MVYGFDGKFMTITESVITCLHCGAAKSEYLLLARAWDGPAGAENATIAWLWTQ